MTIGDGESKGKRAHFLFGNPQLRTVWSITALVLVLSATVILARAFISGAGSPGPEFEADVNRMLARLEEDPQLRRDATRAAVEAVAFYAEQDTEPQPEAYFALGIRLQGEGRPEDAEDAYRAAIELSPEWSRAHYGLGVVLHEMDRLGEAETALRRAIELDPEWSRAHNGLAILLRMTNRLDEARQHAQRAVELAPDNVASRNNYGNLLVRLGRYDEAEEEYRLAIELADGHPAPFYNLACLSSLQSKKEQALFYLEQAIEVDSAFREEAKIDEDFAPIRDSDAFQALVYGAS